MGERMAKEKSGTAKPVLKVRTSINWCKIHHSEVFTVFGDQRCALWLFGEEDLFDEDCSFVRAAVSWR